MVKTNKILLMVITLLLSIMLTGCENRPNTNIDEAKKVALKYMEKKYNVSFNVESCKETKGDFTSESVMVDVRMKLADSDNDMEYWVELTPSFTDKDNDGFYDSYTVTSESYWTDYCQTFLNPWIENVISEYTDYSDFLVFASIGYKGIISDDQPPNDMDYILNKGSDAGLSFYIIISESEYKKNKDYEQATEKLVTFLKETGMECDGDLFVYLDQDFEKTAQYKTYWEYVNNFRTIHDVVTENIIQKNK